MIDVEGNMGFQENEPVTYSSELPKVCDGVTSVEMESHPTGEECMRLLNEQNFCYCFSE